jgi:hypothetical protein
MNKPNLMSLLMVAMLTCRVPEGRDDDLVDRPVVRPRRRVGGSKSVAQAGGLTLHRAGSPVGGELGGAVAPDRAVGVGLLRPELKA